jgi:hypothetical protein
MVSLRSNDEHPVLLNNEEVKQMGTKRSDENSASASHQKRSDEWETGDYSIARPTIVASTRDGPAHEIATEREWGASCFPGVQAVIVRLANCIRPVETAGKILPCGRTVFETFGV